MLWLIPIIQAAAAAAKGSQDENNSSMKQLPTGVNLGQSDNLKQNNVNGWAKFAQGGQNG